MICDMTIVCYCWVIIWMRSIHDVFFSKYCCKKVFRQHVYTLSNLLEPIYSHITHIDLIKPTPWGWNIFHVRNYHFTFLYNSQPFQIIKFTKQLHANLTFKPLWFWYFIPRKKLISPLPLPVTLIIVTMSINITSTVSYYTSSSIYFFTNYANDGGIWISLIPNFIQTLNYVI